MGDSQSRRSEPPHALVRPVELPPPRKIAVRVLTKELAEAFAVELLSDVSHSVNSAARAVGIKPDTVKKAIQRALNDTCTTLLDEEICDIVAAAKEEHIRTIRAYGFFSAGRENRVGVSWMQWQLEVQDPRNHPRSKHGELDGGDEGGGGRGPLQVAAGVRYVVSVPADEPEEEP